jgi:hypothetical protein
MSTRYGPTGVRRSAAASSYLMNSVVNRGFAIGPVFLRPDRVVAGFDPMTRPGRHTTETACRASLAIPSSNV